METVNEKNGFFKYVIIVVVLLAAFLVGSSTYVVHQNEYVTVRRFFLSC